MGTWHEYLAVLGEENNMKETTNRLEKLLTTLKDYVSKSSDAELNHKASPEKWSKKEILGHLCDSAINNLQRFMEIQVAKKPYRIRQYERDELVKVNNYQNSEIKEIKDLLFSINTRIKTVISQQTAETLNYEIELYDGKMSDLKFLMTDYVDHFELHVNQIIKSRNT